MCLFIAHQANVPHKRGMVPVEGVSQVPALKTALRALMAQENAAPAVAVLRQTVDTRPAAELDAFADELARIVREGTNIQSNRASIALVLSALKDQESGRETRRSL